MVPLCRSVPFSIASLVGRAFRWLSLLVGLGLFVGLCRVVGLGKFRQALSAASPGGFVIFLLLSLAVFTVYAIRWQRILGACRGGNVASIPRLLGFLAAAHATSFLLPSAHTSGEALRAWLLRRRGVDWTTAAFTVAMDRLVEVSAGSILGPLYVAIFFLATGASPRIERWILAGMAAGFVGLVLLYALALRGDGMIAAFFRRSFLRSLGASVLTIEKRLSEFIRGPHFLPALLLSFLAEALIVGEFWVLLRAFHIALPLPTILAVLVGMGLSHLTPVPGALGSLEATQVGVIALTGGSADLGLAVGLLVRLRETLWVLIGLAVFSFQGRVSIGSTP